MSVGYATTTVNVIELPDIPESLPYAIDDFSLASHLGFRNKIMWWMLGDTRAQYKVYRIPKKKRGQYRIIHSPSDVMLALLQRLHVKFLVPLQEQLGPHVTAYRKNLSITDAVRQHIRKCPVCDEAPKGKTPAKHQCPKRGVYIHMDLQDFFPRTTRAWIRNYLRQQGYSHEVAGYMANLMVVADIPNPKYRKGAKDAYGYPARKFLAGVPQGAPTSGAICNLVADNRLDKHILEYTRMRNKQDKLTGEWVWKYTRYSDDLSFTCGKALSKEERNEVIKDLTGIIRQAGYAVNKSKTKVSHSYHKRKLLGVVFNDHANFPKDEYLRLRAIVHNCVVNGFEHEYERAKQPSADAMVTWLRGKINWVNQVNSVKGQKLLNEFEQAVTKYEEDQEAQDGAGT